MTCVRLDLLDLVGQFRSLETGEERRLRRRHCHKRESHRA